MPYSPVLPLNDTLPWTQIIATAGQLQYDTNWTADSLTDIVVYQRTTGTSANDFAQIVNPINYTCAFIGSTAQVQVNFIPGHVVLSGDIVTITRMTPADRMNLYTNTNFNPTMLNEDFNRIVMMVQERLLCDDYLSIKYNNSETLNPNDITDNILPILPPSYIWEKDAGNDEIIAVPIPTGGGGGGSVTSVGLSTTTLTLGGTNPVTTTGIIAVDLPAIGGLAPGSYTNTNLTVDAYGRITAASNGSGGGGNSGSLVQTVNQMTHGFVVNQIVYWTGSAFALAQADNAADAEVYGIITTVINVNSFIVTLGGLVTGTFSPGVNFLSDMTAGALTTTPPTTPGSIEKPLLIATSATSGLFVNWRGKIIPNPAPEPGSWNAVSANTLMVANANYLTMSGGNLVLTLPTVSNFGDMITVKGFGSSGWKIAQNAGQIINICDQVTTLGATGYINSTDANDSVTLVCNIANTNWTNVGAPQGNIDWN